MPDFEAQLLDRLAIERKMTALLRQYRSDAEQAVVQRADARIDVDQPELSGGVARADGVRRSSMSGNSRLRIFHWVTLMRVMVLSNQVPDNRSASQLCG